MEIKLQELNYSKRVWNMSTKLILITLFIGVPFFGAIEIFGSADFWYEFWTFLKISWVFGAFSTIFILLYLVIPNIYYLYNIEIADEIVRLCYFKYNKKKMISMPNSNFDFKVRKYKLFILPTLFIFEFIPTPTLVNRHSKYIFKQFETDEWDIKLVNYLEHKIAVYKHERMIEMGLLKHNKKPDNFKNADC